MSEKGSSLLSPSFALVIAIILLIGCMMLIGEAIIEPDWSVRIMLVIFGASVGLLAFKIWKLAFHS